MTKAEATVEEHAGMIERGEQRLPEMQAPSQRPLEILTTCGAASNLDTLTNRF